MPDETRLVEAAMRLRGADSDGWDSFVMALREYAATSTRDLLRAGTTDDLLKHQGMALGLTQLAIHMHNAPQLYQKSLERLRNGRQPRTDARAEIWAETPETDSGTG
jgi:hypothetical protein